MFPKRQQGFTLLEVLLAGFILFLTIATMTMVYRGALLSSSKAENSLEISAALPFVRPIVTEQLRAASNATSRVGKGEYGGVIYSWAASAVIKGRPSLDILEINGVADEYEYLLWDVELKLRRDNREKIYTFLELSW